MWFRLAAQQGDARARCDLGSCYYAGKGVEQSAGKAFRCFRAAAFKGCAEAFNNLGYCFRFGHGVRKSEKRAFRCFRAAARAAVRGRSTIWDFATRRDTASRRTHNSPSNGSTERRRAAIPRRRTFCRASAFRRRCRPNRCSNDPPATPSFRRAAGTGRHCTARHCMARTLAESLCIRRDRIMLHCFVRAFLRRRRHISHRFSKETAEKREAQCVKRRRARRTEGGCLDGAGGRDAGGRSSFCSNIGRIRQGELAIRFELSGATVSHHLGVLRESGLIVCERRGQTLIYSLDKAAMQAFSRAVSELVK